MDAEALYKQHERLKNERSNFDWRWEQMAPFLSPTRAGITTQRSAGAKQSIGVFDSTAMMAAEMHANFIAGYIMNPGQRWLSYGMKAPMGRRLDQVEEWMEENRDRTLARCSSSNCYGEATETLVDDVGFGTGCVVLEERPQPVHETMRGFRGFYFQTEKIGRFTVAEGADGLVDTLFRERRVSARVCRDRGWRLTEPMTKAVEAGKGDTLFDLVHAIVPRPKGERSAGAKAMPWASVWIDVKTKSAIHEGGYTRFPAIVPRYQRTAGEVYGRGRGDLAWPDIWTLNQAKSMGLEDHALKLRPPVLVKHDSVIGTIKLVPGGPTTVNTRGQRIQDVIAPYETGSHPEVTSLKEEELRKSIRQIFFIDQILQLMEVSKSEMTAFEFAKKLELLFRQMGPIYGRLHWEFLYQLVATMFLLQYEHGDFSPPPPQVQGTTGEINIEFHNPIALAQKTGDAESLALAYGDLAGMAQVDPAVATAAGRRLDADRAVSGIFAVRGVPATWTRSDEEVEELEAQEAKATEDAAKLQAMGQVADAAGKAAPMVKAMQPAGQAA